MLNANYLKALLAEDGIGEYLPIAFDRTCMHEFVLSGRGAKEQLGVKTLDIAKRMLDHGVHPPTVYFPLLVDEALMVEPTETETKERLDHFAARDPRDPRGGRRGPRGGPQRAPHHAGAAPRRGRRRQAAGGALAAGGGDAARRRASAVSAPARRGNESAVAGMGGIAPGSKDLSRQRDRQAAWVLVVAGAIALLFFTPLALVLGVLALASSGVRRLAGAAALAWPAAVVAGIACLSVILWSLAHGWTGGLAT